MSGFLKRNSTNSGQVLIQILVTEEGAYYYYGCREKVNICSLCEQCVNNKSCLNLNRIVIAILNIWCENSIAITSNDVELKVHTTHMFKTLKKIP